METRLYIKYKDGNQKNMYVDYPVKSNGYSGTTIGELVFNTSMTGYQEILTDPSYKGQIVLMTANHIGNTGVNTEDVESERVWPRGLLARNIDLIKKPSNWRSEKNIVEYSKENKFSLVSGIDTRYITKLIRNNTNVVACISSEDRNSVKKLLDQFSYEDESKASDASRSFAANKTKTGNGFKVNLIDCGYKSNISRLLTKYGCDVTVVNVNDSLFNWTNDCDALFFSNGPGDPTVMTEAIDKIKSIMGTKPMLGICMGHQLISLAIGGKVYKMPFGHRGANHPVIDLKTKKIAITSQNHGYCVDRSIGEIATITHINLNDQTVAGIECYKNKVSSVQYHPEAKPGPEESNKLIEQFIKFARSFNA